MSKPLFMARVAEAGRKINTRVVLPAMIAFQFASCSPFPDKLDEIDKLKADLDKISLVRAQQEQRWLALDQKADSLGVLILKESGEFAKKDSVSFSEGLKYSLTQLLRIRIVEVIREAQAEVGDSSLSTLREKWRLDDELAKARFGAYWPFYVAMIFAAIGLAFVWEAVKRKTRELFGREEQA